VVDGEAFELFEEDLVEGGVYLVLVDDGTFLIEGFFGIVQRCFLFRHCRI
jgi:hypothetical protein